MSTIYSFHQEAAALLTVASDDVALVYDTSTGIVKKATAQALSIGVLGDAATDVVGFYGETGVNQGTMAATAVTALATVTMEAATTSTFGFASSTVAKALALRVPQLQVDLDVLMARIDSTGLLSITGL